MKLWDLQIWLTENDYPDLIAFENISGMGFTDGDTSVYLRDFDTLEDAAEMF